MLKGIVGKQIGNNTFYTDDIVTFKPVKVWNPIPELSAEVIRNMSSDQAYL